MYVLSSSISGLEIIHLFAKMGRKCSVYGCNSGYDSQQQTQKVTVYKFPDDEEECRKWVICLPNKISKVTKWMGICALHWPTDTPLQHNKKGSRFPVPAVPPSIFSNVPASCVPSHSSSTPRSTKKALSCARNVDIDELDAFKTADQLHYSIFQSSFKERFSYLGFIVWSEDECIILSKERTGSIHSFSLYLNLQKGDSDQAFVSYDAYHKLKQIFHPSVRNPVRSWSELEEVIRFMKNFSCEDDVKLNFLCQAVHKYNCPKNDRIYSLEDFSQSFNWYAKSRTLYEDLRNYLQLPSLTTLRRITRVAKNLEDDSLFQSVFSQLEGRSKGCILIIDEVYIKASLTYRGGSIYGYAVDYPGKLATTFLCVMVKCFFGSKSFLVKLIPCHALKSDFQYTVVTDVILSLEKCGASVVALVCDNNRVNQRFFNMFSVTDPACPWVAQSPVDPARPLFLIFDPVHILKNIRNSWMTEKTQRLVFDHEGSSLTAQWSDLKQLYQHESQQLLKLSSLSKSAIQPNNIEKQKVSLALQVFCDKTSAALKTSVICSQSSLQTAVFIDKVNKLWKVFNCKTPFQSLFTRDPDRAVIDSSDQGANQVRTLMEWVEFAKSLQPKGTPRVCSLTSDTSKAIQWTCQCLVDLSRYLIQSDTPYNHKYVTLGFFQQDDIEKHFAHFRMSAGNNFYITASDVMNTHAIDKAQLMLETQSDNIDFTFSAHVCHLCQKPLTDAELLLLDELTDLIQTIPCDEKMSLFYIGGYICQKHDNPDLQGESSSFPDLNVYTNTLDKGGLKFPSQTLYQLLSLIFAFLKQNKETSCRKRLIKVFSDFPSIFHLDIDVSSAMLSRIVNIILKRICLLHENENTQAKKRKIAKLSSTNQGQ